MKDQNICHVDENGALKCTKKLEYNLAQGKDQSAFLIGYRPQSEKLVEMTPKEFLKLTIPHKYGKFLLNPAVVSAQDLPPVIGELNLTGLKQKLVNGDKLDALYLDVDVNTFKVQRHEGRHRALAAAQLGIETVPVLLYARDGYDWALAKELPNVKDIRPQA